MELPLSEKRQLFLILCHYISEQLHISGISTVMNIRHFNVELILFSWNYHYLYAISNYVHVHSRSNSYPRRCDVHVVDEEPQSLWRTATTTIPTTTIDNCCVAAVLISPILVTNWCDLSRRSGSTEKQSESSVGSMWTIVQAYAYNLSVHLSQHK